MTSSPPDKLAADQFPLLRRCFVAGDVLALFPLLKDWPSNDLKELYKEIDDVSQRVGKEWAKLAMQPSFFFNAGKSKSLDDALFNFNCILSEIASVAAYYMERT